MADTELAVHQIISDMEPNMFEVLNLANLLAMAANSIDGREGHSISSGALAIVAASERLLGQFREVFEATKAK